MSASDRDLASTLRALAETLEQGGEPDENTLRGLVSATTRLYAAAAENAEPAALEQDVSPTEAVVLASALLRAKDLNPFDLAVWFSRSAPPR